MPSSAGPVEVAAEIAECNGDEKVTEAHVYKAKNKLSLIASLKHKDAAHKQAGPDVYIDKRGAIGRKAHHW